MSASIFSSSITVSLPSPKKGTLLLEDVFQERRSIRDYTNQPLTLEEVSNLLWAGYGRNNYARTVPSTGALYPITIYAVVANVENIKRGVYPYQPDSHILVMAHSGDVRNELYKASLSQVWVREAPLVIVVCVSFSITTNYYGERGVWYIYGGRSYCAECIFTIYSFKFRDSFCRCFL